MFCVLFITGTLSSHKTLGACELAYWRLSCQSTGTSSIPYYKKCGSSSQSKSSEKFYFRYVVTTSISSTYIYLANQTQPVDFESVNENINTKKPGYCLENNVKLGMFFAVNRHIFKDGDVIAANRCPRSLWRINRTGSSPDRFTCGTQIR